MFRMKPRTLLSLLLVIALAGSLVSGEIHRAKTLKQKSTKAGRIGETDIAGRRGGTTKEKHSRETWILSIISAILVGLSGIFPLLIIPIEAGKSLRKGAAAARLKLLLSFAVGGLLGDVFLHLLPEAWKHVEQGDHSGHMNIGLWVLGGILAFLIIEKLFPDGEDDEEDDEDDINIDSTLDIPVKDIAESTTTTAKLRKITKSDNTILNNGYTNGCAKSMSNGIKSYTNGTQNGCVGNGRSNKIEPQKKESHIKTSGWLNLLANVVDNFTHGLAVAGSYCAGTKSGILTTIIILLHEIPHEVGDFAILLRSGFDRWKAAKAQLLTASGGVLGALTALGAESASAAGDSTAWILPFTSGGFIYIALVTVVPDLLKEESPLESLKQVLLVCAGIGAMAAVALWLDEHDLPNLEWLTGL